MLKNKYYTVLAVAVLVTIVIFAMHKNIKSIQVITENPDNQEATIMQHFKKGENALTIKLAKKYLAGNSNDVTILNALTETYVNTGDFSSAEATVRRALAIQSNNPWACRLSVSIYSKKKNFVLAKEQLEKGLASNPNDFMLLAEAAKLYAVQGDKAKASQEIEKALNIAPNDPYLMQLKEEIINEKMKK